MVGNRTGRAEEYECEVSTIFLYLRTCSLEIVKDIHCISCTYNFLMTERWKRLLDPVLCMRSDRV